MIPLENIIALLASSIGEAKAREELLAAFAMDGLVAPRQVTRDQAAAALERMAAKPGLIGISARFAKSRVFFM